MSKRASNSSSSNSAHSDSRSSSAVSRSVLTDVRVEEGKLFYQKRWFRRGQAVQVELKGGERYPAMISAIGEWTRPDVCSSLRNVMLNRAFLTTGSDALWVRKERDNSKVRINLSHLARGKFVLKRRAA